MTYKECLTETAYATTDWAADYLNENMICAGEAAGGSGGVFLLHCIFNYFKKKDQLLPLYCIASYYNKV